jgi:hypothetical protein
MIRRRAMVTLVLFNRRGTLELRRLGSDNIDI